ncbi:MAG: twin-arginine translocation signal domain-containing protein [Prolixibacteraceae bacterium]
MENSRRQFIKKSAIGAAGITIGGVGMSAKSYGSILAPTTK